jgi:diguanylate cyclase (GGDEF)-like protein/PAS domain S-box-containing protein
MEPTTAFSAWQAIIRQCADAMALFDQTGEIGFANEAWDGLWTVSPGAAPFVAALHPEFPAILARLDAGAANVSVRLRLGAPEDAPRWLNLSVSRIDDGATVRFLAVAADSTDHELLSRQMKLARLVMDATARVGIVTDRAGAAVFVNASFERLFGYRREDVIGRKPIDLLSGVGTDPRQCGRVRRRLAAGRTAASAEMLLYDARGQEVWTSVTTQTVLNPRGETVSYVLLLEDVGESRKIRTMQRVVLDAIAKDRPLAEVADLLCRQIRRIAPDVTPSILRVDPEGRVHPVAAPGLPAAFAALIDGAAIGPMAGSCGAAAWSGRPVLSRDIETDPNWAPFRHLPLAAGLRACWSSPIRGKDGRTLGAFAFYFPERRGPNAWHRRIVAASLGLCALAIDRYEAQAEIERLAYHDSLTELPNRSRLRDGFEALKARPRGLERAAFFFIDIDNFKDVNDTLGHAAGDDLLAATARTLKALVGRDDILVRHGGDEFVIVLPGADADDATAFAEKVRAAFREPVRIGDTRAAAAMSIGVSLYPDDGADADTLLTNADAAMYAAKRSGRGGACRFDPAMRREAEDRVALSHALREALAGDRLTLHFQPQVWAGTGVLRGVEALARWRDPVLGDVSPSRFIPIAEEYGLIGALGRWSLHAAAAQLASWRAEGLAVPQVSVNLSPSQLQDPALVETVARAIVDRGLRPGDLTLELTEGALMQHPTTAVETARTLSALGVCISLDDFGAGYSNMARLAQLPIGELKIDRSFMIGIAEDANARAVASIAVQIGKALRMTVVAEGVETPEQKQVLQELGCDVLQGYLCAPAMPAERLADWLIDPARQARRDAA